MTPIGRRRERFVQKDVAVLERFQVLVYLSNFAKQPGLAWSSVANSDISGSRKDYLEMVRVSFFD